MRLSSSGASLLSLPVAERAESYEITNYGAERLCEFRNRESENSIWGRAVVSNTALSLLDASAARRVEEDEEPPTLSCFVCVS